MTIGRHAIPRRTEYEVYKKDWDAAKERVRPSNKNFSSINNALGRLLEDAEREFADRDAQGQVPSSKEIVEATFANHDFYEFAQSRIDAMNGETEIRTKRKYITWLAGLKEYAPALAFAQITADFVSGYKAHLKSKGNKHNTIVGRLSTFRATVNAAPAHLRGTAFKETTVGTYRAAENKTALSIQDITTLWNYHAQTLGEALVRDAFLFSYYAAGMRIGDVIQLKWADVSEPRIIYQEGKKRHLGSGKLYIPLNAYAMELIEPQPQTGAYIFGELRGKTATEIAAEIESREATMNSTLFKIAIRAGINKRITSKVARDTFADIANKRSQRDVYSISKAMGHS